MNITISPVTRADVPMLHHALSQLSSDLGDAHLASLDSLTQASDTWRALLAVEGTIPVGALLATPLFSTTRGGLGLYVSDLWVDGRLRGQGLGARLLAQALNEWSPVFVKLATYQDNASAQAFYSRLGFAAQRETNMILHGAALDRLKGQR